MNEITNCFVNFYVRFIYGWFGCKGFVPLIEGVRGVDRVYRVDPALLNRVHKTYCVCVSVHKLNDQNQ